MSTTNQHLGAEERATRCVSWFIAGNYNGGEATCRRWEAMVTEAVEGRFDGDSDENVAYELAKDLQTWLEEERDDIGSSGLRALVGDRAQSSPFADMLGYMMACVDWQQLALDAVEEEIRQQS